MRARFLHLGVLFMETGRTLEIDALLNTFAPDWLRYAYNSWLIWTSATPQELTDAVKPVLGATDKFIVLTVDASQGIQGVSSQFVWDWINKPRDGNWTPPQPRPLLLPQLSPLDQMLGSPPGPPRKP